MKTLVTVLVVALVLLGVLVIFVKQSSEKQVTDARNELTAAKQELATARGELNAAHSELSTVKTQMVARVADLQATVDRLNAEKAQSEEKLVAVKGELSTLMTERQEQNTRMKTLEEVSQGLSNQLSQVTTDLGNVKQAYTDLEKAHTDALGHLAALRQDYVTAQQEKRDLEAKFNDLGTLRLQVATVKRHMYEEKVAERDRLDRAATLSGNGGFLLRQGEWTTSAPEQRKFPLTEEIHRPQ